jgi:hypothetical protein
MHTSYLPPLYDAESSPEETLTAELFFKFPRPAGSGHGKSQAWRTRECYQALSVIASLGRLGYSPSLNTNHASNRQGA